MDTRKAARKAQCSLNGLHEHANNHYKTREREGWEGKQNRASASASIEAQQRTQKNNLVQARSQKLNKEEAIPSPSYPIPPSLPPFL